MAADGIIDSPPGQNDFRVVSQFLCFRRQIVGVYADAVTPDKSRLELQEIPLRCGRIEHIAGADAHQVANDRKLIHQRNIQITLRVLQNFGSFGDFD
jgi:hypothetical protein